MITEKLKLGSIFNLRPNTIPGGGVPVGNDQDTVEKPKLIKANLARYIRLGIGLTFILQLFYLIGHYWSGWPFPTPAVILQIFTTVGLGMLLGAVFSKVWPLPPQKGYERVMRTLLVAIPSLGLGMGLQLLVLPIITGHQTEQAYFMIFTLAAWLGSGYYMREPDPAKDKPAKDKTGPGKGRTAARNKPVK